MWFFCSVDHRIPMSIRDGQKFYGMKWNNHGKSSFFVNLFIYFKFATDTIHGGSRNGTPGNNRKWESSTGWWFFDGLQIPSILIWSTLSTKVKRASSLLDRPHYFHAGSSHLPAYELNLPWTSSGNPVITRPWCLLKRTRKKMSNKLHLNLSQ